MRAAARSATNLSGCTASLCSMPVRARLAALAVTGLSACLVTSAHAAPPQGFQPDASFAASYASRGVTAIAAAAEADSCYAPSGVDGAARTPSQGYLDGVSTLCAGAATTGENVGPY